MKFLSALGRLFQTFCPIKVPFLSFCPFYVTLFSFVRSRAIKIKFRLRSKVSKMRFCVHSRQQSQGVHPYTSTLEACPSQIHQIRKKKLGKFCNHNTQKLGKNPNFKVISEIQRAKFGVFVTYICHLLFQLLLLATRSTKELCFDWFKLYSSLFK